MTKKEVNDSIFSLNFISNTLKIYGERNDYDQELLLKHLEDVRTLIELDKQNKPQNK